MEKNKSLLRLYPKNPKTTQMQRDPLFQKNNNSASSARVQMRTNSSTWTLFLSKCATPARKFAPPRLKVHLTCSQSKAKIGNMREWHGCLSPFYIGPSPPKTPQRNFSKHIYQHLNLEKNNENCLLVAFFCQFRIKHASMHIPQNITKLF